MAQDVVLDAVRRDLTGKKVKTLRRAGKLPAVIYGAGVEPTPIVLDLKETSRIMRSVTSATLVTINLDGKTHVALVRERQYDVLKRELSHVDFNAVAMNVVLRTSVPLRLVGESSAVKDFGAMIIQEAESLEVEALPSDLPQSIDVDISALKELGENLTVADLKLGAEVTILDDPDMVLVIAIAPSQEEIPVEEFVGVVEPEVIERGKREEEEED